MSAVGERGSRRVIGLWLPDWPVQAAWIAGAVRNTRRAGQDTSAALTASMMPIALVGAGGVLGCSRAARRAGVRRGQSRRHAQAACPELVVIDEDAGRDAQEFEPVLERVEAIAAGVEAVRPGLIVVDGYGPTRYYGSEERVIELLLDAVALPGVDCQVGVADDIVTAILAARRGVLLPAGKGRQFRAGVSLAEVAAEVALGFPARLQESWLDLGLRTLGDIAGMSARDMATRFGMEGAKWHGIAQSGAVELVAPRQAPADLSVIHSADEPLNRVDVAAFIARTLAAQLHEKLRDHGLSCYRLGISAVFNDQQELRRVWRCAEPLDEVMTAERVRWQLDGWLQRRTEESSTENSTVDKGIVELRLEPLDVTVAGAIRDALWGGADDASERALRAANRVQGVLGPEAVTKPFLAGGRGPSERVGKIPVGERIEADKSAWPGAIPAPNPAAGYLTAGYPADEQSVLRHAASHPAASVQVMDIEGVPIVVTGRATVPRPPAFIRWGSQQMTVTGWAGPWPVDERWWDKESAHRAVRLQVVVATEKADQGGDAVAAFLLIGQRGKWRIEGRYT